LKWCRVNRANEVFGFRGGRRDGQHRVTPRQFLWIVNAIPALWRGQDDRLTPEKLAIKFQRYVESRSWELGSDWQQTALDQLNAELDAARKKKGSGAKH